MQVDVGSDGVYDYFLPDVWVTNDYYPFGMLQLKKNGKANIGNISNIILDKNGEQIN